MNSKNKIMIEAIELYRSFGDVKAVQGVSLTIPAGEIYGLVGSDGAGKTTTLRLLVGALRADSGLVKICGFSIDDQIEQARTKMGYLSQRFSLYEDLTVLENIRFFAEVRGLTASDWLPRSMEILEFVGLAQFKDRRAGLLSGGMKQKLGLASALVSKSRVLLLDEPTTGVDPVTRQDFWQLLVRLVSRSTHASEKVAVIITTPYMDEAARCTRVGFIKQGRIIAEGTPTQLRDRYNGRILELCGSPIRDLRIIAAEVPGIEDVRLFGDRLHLRTRAGVSSEIITKLGDHIKESHQKLESIRPVPASLEDVFIILSEQGVQVENSKLALSEKHSKALKILLDHIPPNDFKWALTGSANLRLQGVNIEVQDIDIHCDLEDIHRIEKALKEFLITPVHIWETGSIRSLDGKCEIEGIEIELISATEVKDEFGNWQKIQGPVQNNYLGWEGFQVPVIALKDEAHYYKERGREEKVLLIEERISDIKENNHA